MARRLGHETIERALRADRAALDTLARISHGWAPRGASAIVKALELRLAYSQPRPAVRVADADGKPLSIRIDLTAADLTPNPRDKTVRLGADAVKRLPPAPPSQPQASSGNGTPAAPAIAPRRAVQARPPVVRRRAQTPPPPGTPEKGGQAAAGGPCATYAEPVGESVAKVAESREPGGEEWESATAPEQGGDPHLSGGEEV